MQRDLFFRARTQILVRSDPQFYIGEQNCQTKNLVNILRKQPKVMVVSSEVRFFL
jgi:hypothetical protein